MRRATKRRVRLFLRFLLVGTLIGVAYNSFIDLIFFSGSMFPRSLVGAIDGAAITAPIAAMEMFLLRTRWGRPLQQAPFLMTFGAKWLVYGTIITAVIAGEPGTRVLGLTPSAAPLQNPLARLAVLFSFMAAFAFLFVFEISQIVGPRNLRNIVFGRYHRPRVEARFFLFLDIAGSTSLAEQMGPAAVHRFLARVFRLASDPIGDYSGEVYQYVGDEMVVTWTAAEARGDARPIACFFAIVAAPPGGGAGVRAGVWRGAAPARGAPRRAGDQRRDRGQQARCRLSRRRDEHRRPFGAGHTRPRSELPGLDRRPEPTCGHRAVRPRAPRATGAARPGGAGRSLRCGRHAIVASRGRIGNQDLFPPSRSRLEPVFESRSRFR